MLVRSHAQAVAVRRERLQDASPLPEGATPRPVFSLGNGDLEPERIRTLEAVVERGTGQKALLAGFTVAGKTEVNKVPLLGDIPYVGNLFKNTLRSTKKTELLVFITENSDVSGAEKIHRSGGLRKSKRPRKA